MQKVISPSSNSCSFKQNSIDGKYSCFWGHLLLTTWKLLIKQCNVYHLDLHLRNLSFLREIPAEFWTKVHIHLLENTELTRSVCGDIQENNSQSKVKRHHSAGSRHSVPRLQDWISSWAGKIQGSDGTGDPWFRSPVQMTSEVELETKSKSQKGHALCCFFSEYCITSEKKKSLKCINIKWSLAFTAN